MTLLVNQKIVTVSEDLKNITVSSTGAQGLTGSTGLTGVGLVTGGTTGQFLAKIDATDFNTHWISGGTGDMTAAVYDTTLNGIVDNAEK